MHVVLEEERHARKGAVPERRASRAPGLVQGPFRHAGQLWLDLFQPLNGYLDEFGRADVSLPHEFGKRCGVTGDVILGKAHHHSPGLVEAAEDSERAAVPAAA
jgi:hypothetical protein